MEHKLLKSSPDADHSKTSKRHRKNRRGFQESVLPTLPGHVPLLRFQTCLQMIALTLKGIVGGKTDEDTMFKFRQLKTNNSPQFQTTSATLRNLVRKVYGTYMPKLPFRSYDPAVLTVAAGVLNTVVTLESSILAGFGYYASIFDEYRPGGKFRVKYGVVTAGVMYAVGVIDYADATALATTAEGMLYDTAKVFLLCNSVITKDSVTEWEGHLMGQPDFAWLATNVTSTDFAYWKVYGVYNLTNTIVGILWFEDVMIEFRQQGT